MKKIVVLGMLLFGLVIIGHAKKLKPLSLNDTLEVKAKLLYQPDFAKDSLSKWIPEIVDDSGRGVFVNDGRMEVEVGCGCTVWFNEKLTGPVMIEYDVVVIDNVGAFDRVSDLNCFWMATDPQYPDDMFKQSEFRSGDFSNYTPLSLYYVGYGGNKNKTTRFRRYDGEGNRPLLEKNDLRDPEYLIKANETYKIRLIAYDGIVQYYRNGELIFDFFDPNPFTSGYFGLRTVRNHLSLGNFKVYSLSQKKH
jgi:hypothetical protein